MEYDDQDGGGKASPSHSPRRKKQNSNKYTGYSMASVAAPALPLLSTPRDLFGNDGSYFGNGNGMMTGAYNNDYTMGMLSAYTNQTFASSAMPTATAMYTPPTIVRLPPMQTQTGPTNDTAAWTCSWNTSSTRCVCRGALQLFPCCEDECEEMVSHVCQVEWESEVGDDSREVGVGLRYCPRHHPFASTPLIPRSRLIGGHNRNGGNDNGETGTLVGGVAVAGGVVGRGLNRYNNNDLGGHANDGDGEDDNRRHYLDMGTCEEVERVWLGSLTSVKNVQKAYDDVIKAEDANKIASTVTIGDYVYNIQSLLTMAQGALTAGEMQQSRLDDYVERKWIKKSQIKTTVPLMGKEILRRHEIKTKFPFDDTEYFDADLDITDASNNEDARAKFLKRPASTGSVSALKEVMEYRCKLHFKTEKKWIVDKIDEVLNLNAVKAYHDQQQLARHQSGENLNASKHTLLRLIAGMYCIVLCIGCICSIPLTFLYVSLLLTLSNICQQKPRCIYTTV